MVELRERSFRLCGLLTADPLLPQSEAADSDGQSFLAADSAEAVVYGGNDVPSQSVDKRYREPLPGWRAPAEKSPTGR